MLGYRFDLVMPLEIERDVNGIIREFMPQARYRNMRKLPLNKHGLGPFCQFRIAVNSSKAGVYALTLDNEIVYIGECQHLSDRFGPRGYGTIHPRNCFQGGQATNCKVNSLILQNAKENRRIDVCFLSTSDRKRIERELISKLRPPWNSLLRISRGLGLFSSEQKPSMEVSMPVFKLTLEETYYGQGFFNITVDFGRFVRPDDGPVNLVLGSSGPTIQGQVNRTANRNGTPRIMGGAELRNWFQSNFQPRDVVDVDLSSFTSIRLG